MSNDAMPVDSPADIERWMSTDACNVLNELRRNGELCDAVLRVQDRQFPVHRAIMSACSPYFRALFTNGMHETGQREIKIPGVTSDMMEIIVEYAYTRKIKVPVAMVEQLLPAADQFHILGLVKACCDYLALKLDIDNCLGIRKFAAFYFCAELEKTAQRYVLENFPEIAKRSKELLHLTVDEMVALLSADDLNVKNEEIVFDALIRWIDHQPRQRRTHIETLLQTVRLGLLSKRFFVEKVKGHPYVQNNDDCRLLVIETLKFLYDLDFVNGKDVDLSHPLARPRIPYEILFVVGGWSGGSPTNVIETYDTRADRWVMVDQTDSAPRAYHGCATLEGIVYVIGGFDGTNYFNSVRAYNPVTKEWREAAPMNCKRCYVSVAVLDTHVYALGGFDGNVRQNTAERYTPSTNQWSVIPSMNQHRSDASACSLAGKVYICGGFNGQECLSSCESFNPLINQWTLIAPMRNLRSGVGVISHAGSLYAVGGFNGITRMNSGERWNPTNNTWQAIAEMYSPRSNFAIEVIDDLLFVIGGFNGVTTIYSVECFDTTTEEWYDCMDMNIYRSALNACVLRGLPNVQDYIPNDRHKTEEKKKEPTASSN